jgi:hypothetical protein
MARFESNLPTDLIKQFETLEVNTEKMLGEMVETGAEVARQNIEAKMPSALRESLGSDNIIVSRVYKTPSDDGINCQAMIVGYFTNRNGERIPAPLVANVFEYGRSNSPYPKQPFFRRSFNKGQIEKAMLRVQEKYIKGD